MALTCAWHTAKFHDRLAAVQSGLSPGTSNLSRRRSRRRPSSVIPAKLQIRCSSRPLADLAPVGSLVEPALRYRADRGTALQSNAGLTAR